MNEFKKVVRMGSLLVLQESENNNQTTNSDIYSIVNSIGLGNSESVRNVVLNTANGILDTVDVVGDSAEGAVKNWNKWVGGIPMRYGSQAIFKPLLDSLKNALLRKNNSDNIDTSSSGISGVRAMLPITSSSDGEVVKEYIKTDLHNSGSHSNSHSYIGRSSTSSFYWPPLVGTWDNNKGRSSTGTDSSTDTSTSTQTSTDEDAGVKQ